MLSAWYTFLIMEDQKPPIPRAVLVVGAVVLVLVTIGMTVFSTLRERKQGDPAPEAASQVTEGSSAAVPVPPSPSVSKKNSPNQVVMGVYKDSVLRSLDSGATFETYFKIATVTTAKMGVADVLSISFHPENKDDIVVTTYQDGIFVNQDRVNEWTPVAFPPKLIYSFILDRRDPDQRVFASGVVSGNGRIFRTGDAGETWSAVYAEPGMNTFVSALVQDPKDPSVIIAGTNVGTLVRSTDGGDTWKNVGQKISGRVSNFTYDASRRAFAYLLLLKGKVYHSSDGGLSWVNWEEEKVKEVKALYERANEVAREGDTEGAKSLREQAAALERRNKEDKAPSNILYIVADPTKSGTVYVSTVGGIYRSTDFGKYWKPLDVIESVTRFPIPSVAINPKNSNEIVFVAGRSFYRSTNGGATWAITPLDNTRNASFVAYDPFDPKVIFVGMSAK